MDLKKLADVLVFAGVVAIILALFWWESFYGPIMKQLGGDLSNAYTCIYSSGGWCGVTSGVAEMIGKTPYNPMLFQAGVVSLIAGIIMWATLK